MRQRLLLMTALAAPMLAQGHAAGQAGAQTVTVHVAGKHLSIPVPPDLTVAGPELLSAEQSAAVPLGYRLMVVLSNRAGPAAGARLVLIETTADRQGLMSPAAFARMKKLVRNNVAALAVRSGSAARGANVVRPRVFVDEPDALAWIGPTAVATGNGGSDSPALAATLYLLIRGRILVVSFRTDRVSSAEAGWIRRETHRLLAAIRAANGD